MGRALMAPTRRARPVTSSIALVRSSASSRRRSRTRSPRRSRGIEWGIHRIRGTRTVPRSWRLQESRERVAQQLARQATWCADLGSPLYALLLASAAADLEEDQSPVWEVLKGFQDEP